MKSLVDISMIIPGYDSAKFFLFLMSVLVFSIWIGVKGESK